MVVLELYYPLTGEGETDLGALNLMVLPPSHYPGK